MDVDILTYDDLVVDGENVGKENTTSFLSALYTLMRPWASPVADSYAIVVVQHLQQRR